jgi:Ca2+-binding RTX toxin-like protein
MSGLVPTGTIYIPTGSTTGLLTFNVTNDSKTEGTESFSVTLDSATGATLGSTTQIDTTINDTSLTPSVNPTVNHPPTGSVTISGTPQVGQTLTASNTLADADGMGVVSYTWYSKTVGSNYFLVPNANQSTYTLTANDVGKSFYVRASYTDLKGNLENYNLFSDDTKFVTAAPQTNVNHEPTGSVTISGVAEVGQTLTANNTLVDADGMGAVSYEWYYTKVGMTYYDYATTQSTYTLTANDIGKSFYVAAVYTDLKGNDEWKSSDDTKFITAATQTNTDETNHPPTGELVIIGEAKVNKTLTVDVSKIADADKLGEFSYQWLSDGEEIENANEATYQLTSAEVGKKISVSIFYIDGADYDEYVESAETVAVKGGISGVTKTGDEKANKLNGTDNDDVLSGLAGKDTLLGKAGNDILDGGEGKDSLTGGFDFDTLKGGAGADKFIFTDIKDAPISTLGIDVITDFTST